MEKDNKDSRLPFKEFLDKTTNLVTLFGVFNALFIYSTTIDSEGASEFLLPSFFILSVFVWLELIFFTVSSNDGTRKYDFFFFLLCSVEIGLLWYFVVKFAGILLLLTFFGIFSIGVVVLTRLFTKIFLRPLVKLKDRKRESLFFLLIVAAILLSGLILIIAAPYLKPLIQKVIPEKVQIKNKNY